MPSRWALPTFGYRLRGKSVSASQFSNKALSAVPDTTARRMLTTDHKPQDLCQNKGFRTLQIIKKNLNPKPETKANTPRRPLRAS